MTELGMTFFLEVVSLIRSQSEVFHKNALADFQQRQSLGFYLQRYSSVLDRQSPRSGKLCGLDELLEFHLCGVFWRADLFEKRKHVAVLVIHAPQQQFVGPHSWRDLHDKSPGCGLRPERRQVP